MNVVYGSLVYVVWFLSTYFVIVFLLSLFKLKEELFDYPPVLTGALPKVSLIVSAYNEAEKITGCLESLKRVDYPKDLFEIIVVNDGSTDATGSIVKEYAKDHDVTLIDNAVNKGKAACLNEGIEHATGTYIACMDADSFVDADIFMKTLPYFKDAQTGAVTVSVKVKNTSTILQKIVELEYILGLSLFLKVFSHCNCVYVTPGPFSVYRSSLLSEMGGFDAKNITEDLEIAYRIRQAGYSVACCLATSVETIIPGTLKTLYRQRKRWYSGALLTLWKHKSFLLTKRAGLFGVFIPFIYSLTALGMVLFVSSTYMGVSRLVQNISFLSLTNFNVLDWIVFKQPDVLSISMFGILAISGIVGTYALLTYGMKITEHTVRKKLVGYVGYAALFFLYQFFWLVSFFTVIFRRKVEW